MVSAKRTESELGLIVGTLRHGNAYWVVDFPPLRGGEPKRRVAIYLDLDDAVSPLPSGCVVCVGASTDVPDPRDDHDALLVRSGLPEACWVYPAWVVETPLDKIDGEAGRLPLVLLELLIERVIDRSWEYEDDAE